MSNKVISCRNLFENKYFRYIIFLDNMKKITVFIILCFTLVINVSADKFVSVKFARCIDGDTAAFILNDMKKKGLDFLLLILQRFILKIILNLLV